MQINTHVMPYSFNSMVSRNVDIRATNLLTKCVRGRMMKIQINKNLMGMAMLIGVVSPFGPDWNIYNYSMDCDEKL